MRLFSYCAYEDSRVGFQLGSAEYDFENKRLKEIKKIKEDDILEKNNKIIKIINPYFSLIDSFFNTVKISKVYGKFPFLEEPKEEYIYLLKNFEEEKDDRDFYLNIAFQTDKKEEYLKIKTFFNEKSKSNNLFDILSKIIDIDKENLDLGININKEELIKLSDEISKIRINNNEKIEDKIYIEVKKNIKNALDKCDRDYEDRITSEIKSGCNLGLLNKNIENEKLEIIYEPNDKKYRLQKKNKINVFLLVLIIMMIMIMLIVLIK